LGVKTPPQTRVLAQDPERRPSSAYWRRMAPSRTAGEGRRIGPGARLRAAEIWLGASRLQALVSARSRVWLPTKARVFCCRPTAGPCRPAHHHTIADDLLSVGANRHRLAARRDGAERTIHAGFYLVRQARWLGEDGRRPPRTQAVKAERPCRKTVPRAPPTGPADGRRRRPPPARGDWSRPSAPRSQLRFPSSRRRTGGHRAAWSGVLQGACKSFKCGTAIPIPAEFR